MGDCRTGTCPTVRYEAPQPTYQQPEKSWCSTAASDAYAGKGTTVVYDGQTKPQYDKMQESFKFNGSKGANEKGGVQDAYAEAIRTGKPLVVVMGKFDGNNPRNVVEQTQKNAKNDAVYLYVDPTTCKDEQLKAYAEQRLKGGHNASMTDVFEFTPGKDGKPDMKKVYSWQGGDPSMVGSFKDALSTTRDNMTANKDKFSKEPIGPGELEQKQIADAKAKAEADKAAADKVAADKVAAEKAAAEKAAADKAAAEKAAAEKAAAEKAAAEKAAADKAAAEKAAADIKAAEERGRLTGRAEVKAENAKTVNDVVGTAIDLAVPIIPITRAGVQVGQKVGEFVVEHPREAAIIAAPTIAIPVIAAEKAVDFAVKNPDVAAKIVISGAMPIVPIVTGGAKLARQAYDLLPEKPSWLP